MVVSKSSMSCSEFTFCEMESFTSLLPAKHFVVSSCVEKSVVYSERYSGEHKPRLGIVAYRPVNSVVSEFIARHRVGLAFTFRERRDILPFQPLAKCRQKDSQERSFFACAKINVQCVCLELRSEDRRYGHLLSRRSSGRRGRRRPSSCHCRGRDRSESQRGRDLQGLPDAQPHGFCRRRRCWGHQTGRYS